MSRPEHRSRLPLKVPSENAVCQETFGRKGGRTHKTRARTHTHTTYTNKRDKDRVSLSDESLLSLKRITGVECRLDGYTRQSKAP